MNFNSLDIWDVVVRLSSSIRAHTNPNVAISAQNEHHTRYFTNTFRRTCAYDPNIIEIMDHFEANMKLLIDIIFFMIVGRTWFKDSVQVLMETTYANL